jgi:cytochrome c oxidase cbb3-type subunit 1
MNAPPSPIIAISIGATAPGPAEIDASSRLPLLTLFGGAAGWLMLSSVFGLIASLKFHAPSFLADSPWLTYGRVHPAATNAMVYGFGLQAGLGVALWLLGRLGRTTMVAPGCAAIAAFFWNLGVAIGLGGILSGDSTGFELLEMPRCASPILFGAYAVIGICGVMTVYRRRESGLYVSQWFLLAALFWFPWIYSTANLLLVFAPVRGVVQAVVNWWYVDNLVVVWLGLMGLGTAFYFMPKLTNQPLQSRYLALFVFWTFILVGGWGGIPGGAPLPAWMPALSAVATVLMVIPALAVAVSARQTLRGQREKVKAATPLRFIAFGVVAFVVAGLMNAASGVRAVNQMTGFTWLGAARAQLGVCGFFAMTMFGAIYHILPRVLGAELPFPRFVRLHFWCGALGILLLAAPLAIGGVVEGFKLNDASVAFIDVMKSTLPFLRASTTGELLIALGNLLFILNVAGLLARLGCARLLAGCKVATAEIQLAEAKP